MSTRIALGFVALALLSASPSAIRADVESTEIPSMATVETHDACKFTVPAKLRPEVVYRVETTFESDREQTLVLLVWAQDDDRTGHWEQRASFNSYFNGRSVSAELPLAPGRTYLLAAYHKKARGPGYGQPWLQSKVEPRPAVVQSSDTAPALAARFAGAQQAAINATLMPIELPVDQSNASPTAAGH